MPRAAALVVTAPRQRRAPHRAALVAFTALSLGLTGCDEVQTIQLGDGGTTTLPSVNLPADESLLTPFPNAAGMVRSLSTVGGFDPKNPFFKPFGKNGKTCEHCHFESDGWGIGYWPKSILL